jgi:hypothetical protein
LVVVAVIIIIIAIRRITTMYLKIKAGTIMITIAPRLFPAAIQLDGEIEVEIEIEIEIEKEKEKEINTPAIHLPETTAITEIIIAITAIYIVLAGENQRPHPIVIEEIMIEIEEMIDSKIIKITERIEIIEVALLIMGMTTILGDLLQLIGTMIKAKARARGLVKLHQVQVCLDILAWILLVVGVVQNLSI